MRRYAHIEEGKEEANKNGDRKIEKEQGGKITRRGIKGRDLR